MQRVQTVYAELFEEIGLVWFYGLQRTDEALASKDFCSRIQAVKSDA